MKPQFQEPGVERASIRQLWRDYHAERRVEIRNRLLEYYLPLVKHHTERLTSPLKEGPDLNDLVSAGVFGLLDAIDKFDVECGVKFETYCVPRILQAVLKELHRMARAARELGDTMETKNAEDASRPMENRDLMRLMTWRVSRNERLIMILYYFQGMTMKEIGLELDLSESRISKMHSSVISRLPQMLATDGQS